jgi:hypothetical protein
MAAKTYGDVLELLISTDVLLSPPDSLYTWRLLEVLLVLLPLVVVVFDISILVWPPPGVDILLWTEPFAGTSTDWPLTVT